MGEAEDTKAPGTILMLPPQLADCGAAPPPWKWVYRSHRWRKMLDRLKEESHRALRKDYCTWLTHRWNSLPGLPSEARIKSSEVFIVQRPIDLGFQIKEPVSDIPEGDGHPVSSLSSPKLSNAATGKGAGTDENPTRADRRPFRTKLLWSWHRDMPDETQVRVSKNSTAKVAQQGKKKPRALVLS